MHACWLLLYSHLTVLLLCYSISVMTEASQGGVLAVFFYILPLINILYVLLYPVVCNDYQP